MMPTEPSKTPPPIIAKGPQQHLTAAKRTEAHVAAEMVRALAAPVVDAYRHFSPTAVAAGFTHAVDTASTARLDRIYVSPELLPSLLCCTVDPMTKLSDH
jgi:endonuclease/exonuclease/phosphatase family metal-dependent hydrolase